MVWKGSIVRIHQRLFQLDSASLSRYYFIFLVSYQLLVIVFFVMPYVALKLTLAH